MGLSMNVRRVGRQDLPFHFISFHLTTATRRKQNRQRIREKNKIDRYLDQYIQNTEQCIPCLILEKITYCICHLIIITLKFYLPTQNRNGGGEGGGGRYYIEYPLPPSLPLSLLF